MDIQVLSVTEDGVEIRTGSVRFTFGRVKGQITIIGKGSDAQVYDPKAFDIPRELFYAAYERAGAIIRAREVDAEMRRIRRAAQLSFEFEATS